jgi:hypothetical protein
MGALVDLKRKKVGVGAQSLKIVWEHFEIWLFGAVLGVF